jgi:sulfur-oxidizing protein SoxZ
MARHTARVAMPSKAAKGDVVEIKTLIQHHMETGYRVDATGKTIPRDIVRKMRVTFRGEEIFFMDFTQGVAANPYVAVAVRAEQSGEFVFAWEDDEKTLATVRKTLTVLG